MESLMLILNLVDGLVRLMLIHDRVLARTTSLLPTSESCVGILSAGSAPRLFV